MSSMPRNALSTLSANAERLPAPTVGKKRKVNEVLEENDKNAVIDREDTYGMHIDKNCDQVRRQIRTYLDSGAKVGEFCEALTVSNVSLNRFLSQNGPMKGSGSDAYFEAWSFFKRRELAGMKMPAKKQKSTSTLNEEGATAKTTTENLTKKDASTNIKEAGNTAGVSISAIHLHGEEFDDVAVHDTCDEVRRKINAHLKKEGVTQAQFCRDMQSMLQSGGAPSKIQSSMLTGFRNKKGARAGATSSVFYAAYVFFEKERIAKGAKKSKHRVDMESIWPRGFDRDRDGSQRFLCGPNKRPYEDKYGVVSFR